LYLGINIVQQLFNKGVAVHVLNIELLENTSMGKFLLTTLLAVAEMERNTILERAQARKEIAKTKVGFKEGRPTSYTQKQLANVICSIF
jgi:DNA invertase Pin-like site-specific DNA recombinase